MTSEPQSFHSKANKMDMLPLNPTEAEMPFKKAFNLCKRDKRWEVAATEMSVLIHQAYPNKGGESVQLRMAVFRILYSSSCDILGDILNSLRGCTKLTSKIWIIL